MKLFDLFATLTLDSGGFDKGLNQAQKAMENASKKISQVVNTVKVAVTTGAIASIGKYVAKTGIAYTAELENYEAQLGVLMGGADKAAEKMKDLSNMAAKTPYDLADVAQATKDLLTAGESSDTVTDTVRRLGDIALGSKDKLSRLTDAFSKMKTMGKVTTEQLQTMQFAGFNPLTLIAEKYKMTQENVNKALSDGKIPISEIEWAIKKATDEGGQFFNGSAVLAETFNGRLATLKENWRAFLGQLTKPAYDVLKDTVLPYAIDLVDRLSKALDENGIQGVLSTAQAEIEKFSGTIVSKVTEYFDSDQAKTDLQKATGKIAKLLTGGNIVLSDVIGFVQGVISSISNTIQDETVNANMADIGEQIIRGIFLVKAGKMNTIINGLSVAGDIVVGLANGITQYLESDQAQTDYQNIASTLIEGIGKIAVTAEKLVNVVTGILKGLASAMSDDRYQDTYASIIVAIGDALASVAVSVIENLPGLLTAGINIADALIKAIAKGIGQLISKLWDAVKALFSGDTDGLVNFGQEIVDAITQGVDWENSAVYLAYTWIADKVSSIPELVESLKKKISGFFSDFKVAYENSPIYTAVNAVKGAIDSVISAAQSAINWLKELFGLQNSGSTDGIYPQDGTVVYDEPIGPPKAPTWDDARGFATGLYSVPYDNFPALLHRNETVLTRAQADEYRKGGSAESKQDVYNINIQSTAESPSETAAYIKQAMRTLRFNQA